MLACLPTRMNACVQAYQPTSRHADSKQSGRVVSPGRALIAVLVKGGNFVKEGN